MSHLEDRLAMFIRAAILPEPQREYRFAPPRRWRFDFAWPHYRLALEIDGGTWIRGKHSRGRGARTDCEKQNAAACLGWRVLRATSDMVSDRSIVDAIAIAIGFDDIERSHHGLPRPGSE